MYIFVMISKNIQIFELAHKYQNSETLLSLIEFCSEQEITLSFIFIYLNLNG